MNMQNHNKDQSFWWTKKTQRYGSSFMTIRSSISILETILLVCLTKENEKQVSICCQECNQSTKNTIRLEKEDWNIENEGLFHTDNMCPRSPALYELFESFSSLTQSMIWFGSYACCYWEGAQTSAIPHYEFYNLR